jgi:hypothetical protein
MPKFLAEAMPPTRLKSAQATKFEGPLSTGTGIYQYQNKNPLSGNGSSSTSKANLPLWGLIDTHISRAPP